MYHNSVTIHISDNENQKIPDLKTKQGYMVPSCRWKGWYPI